MVQLQIINVQDNVSCSYLFINLISVFVRYIIERLVFIFIGFIIIELGDGDFRDYTG